MSDWSLHRHIATVGVLGNAIYDRGWCRGCRKPWPCPVAEAKRDYEGTAMRELAGITEDSERIAFVVAMKAELLRIDGLRASDSPEKTT